MRMIYSIRSKQKTYYNRWVVMSSLSQFLKRCQKVSNVFFNLRKTVKSVADHAFDSNRDQGKK